MGGLSSVWLLILVAMKPFQTNHNGRKQWCCKWKQGGVWHYVYDDSKPRCIEKQMARIAVLGAPAVPAAVNKPVDSKPVIKKIRTIDKVFHERLESLTISDKHYKNQNNLYKKHIQSYIGMLDISDVKAASIDSYLKNLETTDSNKNKIYKLLHALFEYADKKNYINKNIIVNVDKPFYVNQTRILEIETTDKIVETIKNSIYMLSKPDSHYHEYYEMFLLLSLGLRASELIGLTKESFKQWDRCLKIETQLEKRDGKYCLKLGTKGTRGQFNRRTIPLPEQYYRAIINQINKSDKNDAPLIVYFNDKAIETRHALFVRSNGNPIDYEYLRTIWIKIQDEYHDLMNPMDEIQYIRLHAFRHAAATLLAEQGVNIQTAQAFLGHMDKKMTEYYTHLTPDMMMNAATDYANNITFESGLTGAVDEAFEIRRMNQEESDISDNNVIKKNKIHTD